MFSFHKPRVYRSTEGCCICRAKSSRFTDSKKYEEDSVKCFNINQPRQGEICNACVLLVKRYKRLPNGSNRHWGHVVDARVGPGMKSMSKFKKMREETQQQSNVIDKVIKITSTIPEKYAKIVRKHKKTNTQTINIPKKKNEVPGKPWEELTSPATPDSFIGDLDEKIQNGIINNNKHTNDKKRIKANDLSSKIDIKEKNNTADKTKTKGKSNSNATNIRIDTIIQNNTYRSGTVQVSNDLNQGSFRRKVQKPVKNAGHKKDIISFIDENLWHEKKSCCGTYFEYPDIGAIIIDSEKYEPCPLHHNKKSQPFNTSNTSQKTDIFLLNEQNVTSNSNLTVPYCTYAEDNARNSASKLNTTNTFPILKKHHLYFKTQQDNFSVSSNIIITSKKLTSGTITTGNTEPFKVNRNKQSILDKIESETAGKVIKHSINKIHSTERLEHQDIINITKIIRLDEILNPINIKKVDGKITFQNKEKNVEPSPANTKYSDNSSDSGFDENLQDRKSTSPIQEEVIKESQIYVNKPIQKMYLASGIQRERENVILTGNELDTKTLKAKRLQQQQVNLSRKLLRLKNKNMSII